MCSYVIHKRKLLFESHWSSNREGERQQSGDKNQREVEGGRGSPEAGRGCYWYYVEQGHVTSCLQQHVNRGRMSHSCPTTMLTRTMTKALVWSSVGGFPVGQWLNKLCLVMNKNWRYTWLPGHLAWPSKCVAENIIIIIIERYNYVTIL